MTFGNVLKAEFRNQPAILQVVTLTGTSINYQSQLPTNWNAGTQPIGYVFNRSNGGSAMTDTLPNPASLAQGDQGLIPNGINFIINNVDYIPSIVVTPVSPVTINGYSTLTISAGNSYNIVTDGVDYFAFGSATNMPASLIKQALASYAYGNGNNGQTVYRSNTGNAMSDTLPNANTLPLNYRVTIFNLDGSANDVVTPTTSTINGASSLTIAAGGWATIFSNGVNYFAIT